MRGRIRQLKPDVFFDEELWALIQAHPDQHILQSFEGLWVNADREGRFQWRPAMLKSQILPYWGGDFERSMGLLRAEGFIVQYVVDGKVYGWIPAFLDHQRPNNREPESVLPPPPPLEQTQVSLEHAQAGDSSVREPRARPYPHSLPPLPTPSPSDPDLPDQVGSPREAEPGSRPTPEDTDSRAPAAPSRAPVPLDAAEARRVTKASQGGVSRTHSLPSEEPSRDYLEAAVMAGVSADQARSTWAHYWGAGLPDRGVERLHPWLIKRAKERANQLAKASRGRGSRPHSQPDAGIDPWQKATIIQ